MHRAGHIIAFIFFAIGAFSQSVVRGPYLQSPTPAGITVMWRTNGTTSTALWLGSHPDSLVLHSNSITGVRDHAVRITGLLPDRTYYYAVGTGSTVLAGQDIDHRFRTFPIPGSSGPLRVWATGDFGKGNAGQIAVKESFMAYPGSADTDVWIWLGDNVYDNGTDDEYQEKLFGLAGYKDVFNWLPFCPAPGNHDYNEVWSQSAFLGIPYSNIALESHAGPYYDLVDVPREGQAGGRPSHLELFYSFDLGDVHFISLNSEVYDYFNTFNGIDRMVDWLELDLAQNERLFTVAYFHQPPYSKGSHDSDGWLELVMKAMRERVVPMLESFDVDLVIGGHSHVYERSHLIHGHYGSSGSFNASTMLRDGGGGNFDSGTPYVKDILPGTPDGTVYVVCGNSASGEPGAVLDHPVMASADGDAIGSFIIDVQGHRLDGTYLRSDGTIGDAFTILKGEAPIGMMEHDGASVFEAYPNPTDGIVDLHAKGMAGKALLRVVDIGGRTVLSRIVDLPRTRIDLSGAAAGTYQLMLSSAVRTMRARVVVK